MSLFGQRLYRIAALDFRQIPLYQGFEQRKKICERLKFLDTLGPY